MALLQALPQLCQDRLHCKHKDQVQSMKAVTTGKDNIVSFLSEPRVVHHKGMDPCGTIHMLLFSPFADRMVGAMKCLGLSPHPERGHSPPGGFTARMRTSLFSATCLQLSSDVTPKLSNTRRLSRLTSVQNIDAAGTTPETCQLLAMASAIWPAPAGKQEHRQEPGVK